MRNGWWRSEDLLVVEWLQLVVANLACSKIDTMSNALLNPSQVTSFHELISSNLCLMSTAVMVSDLYGSVSMGKNRNYFIALVPFMSIEKELKRT